MKNIHVCCSGEAEFLLKGPSGGKDKHLNRLRSICPRFRFCVRTAEAEIRLSGDQASSLGSGYCAGGAPRVASPLLTASRRAASCRANPVRAAAAAHEKSRD